MVTGVGWSLVQSYHIMFNPLWQDELSSLAAAQGMRAHLVPEWPSGFLYWKSELYTALIAVLGGLTHDDPSVLREFTVVWFGATILHVGLGLMPLVLPGRRVWQLVATVVFATAPFEMGHAQDIRMYQMLQCVVVVVALLLLRALRRPTTRHHRLADGGRCRPCTSPTRSPSGSSSSSPWRCAVRSACGGCATGAGGCSAERRVAAICVQLALAKFTHPPTSGSTRAGGRWSRGRPSPSTTSPTTSSPTPTYGASITVVSTLAVRRDRGGAIRRDALRLYLAAFWVVPTGRGVAGAR